HVNVAKAQELYTLVRQAIGKGYIRACHDLSEGGLAVSAAEMAFAGNLGIDLDVSHVLAPESLPSVSMLFSETPSRFLVEVPDIARQGFETLLKGSTGRLGRVTRSKSLVIREKRRILIRQPLTRLRKAWEGAS